MVIRIENLDIKRNGDPCTMPEACTLKQLFDVLNLDYSKFCSSMRDRQYVTIAFGANAVLLNKYDFVFKKNGFDAIASVHSTMFTDKAMKLFANSDIKINADCYQNAKKGEENKMQIKFFNLEDGEEEALKHDINYAIHAGVNRTISWIDLCQRFLNINPFKLWEIVENIFGNKGFTKIHRKNFSIFKLVVRVTYEINCKTDETIFLADIPTDVFVNADGVELPDFAVDVEKFRENTTEDNMNMVYKQGSGYYADTDEFHCITKATNPSSVPDILKIEFFDQGLPTIKVTFVDHTHTTATCKENDVFDFDIGLGICLAKRAIGPKFNRMIEKAHKLYIRQKEAKLKVAMDHEEEAKREIRKAQKKAQKTARKEAEWRQEQIDILAQAIKKAHEDSGSEEVTHKDVFKIAASMIKKADDRKDRNKRILELRARGKTYKEIARELHVSKSTIGEVIREANKQ